MDFSNKLFASLCIVYIILGSCMVSTELLKKLDNRVETKMMSLYDSRICI